MRGGGGRPPLPTSGNQTRLRKLARPVVADTRRLRKAMTPPEIMLWQRLRVRPVGLKFRRQHPIDRYVADFFCATARLVVEVDGRVHDDAVVAAHDAERGADLIRRGYHVVRIAACDVMWNADEAAASIVEAARATIGVETADAPLHRPSDGPPPRAGEDKE